MICTLYLSGLFHYTATLLFIFKSVLFESLPVTQIFSQDQSQCLNLNMRISFDEEGSFKTFSVLKYLPWKYESRRERFWGS